MLHYTADCDRQCFQSLLVRRIKLLFFSLFIQFCYCLPWKSKSPETFSSFALVQANLFQIKKKSEYRERERKSWTCPTMIIYEIKSIKLINESFSLSLSLPHSHMNEFCIAKEKWDLFLESYFFHAFLPFKLKIISVFVCECREKLARNYNN